MDSNYAKAYKEVIEVLNYIPESDKEKIPKEIYQALEDKMDNDYLFELDESKSFENQELSVQTKAILTIFYRDYWATPEIKAKILAKQINELIKIEQEKKIKYNSEEIFKKVDETPANEDLQEPESSEEILKKVDETSKLEMIIYKEEHWYSKFIGYMKKIFNKKRDN